MAIRNTAYQFIRTEASEIERWLIHQWELILGMTVQPGSPERLYIQFMAYVLLYERNYFNQMANQNLPSRALGSHLDELGQLFYAKTRPSESKASCTERFYLTETQTRSVLVPKGTRITDGGATYYWTTDADAWIPAGSLYVDTTVTCQTAGEVGNDWAAGDLNVIVDVYDYYDRCENITTSDGGSDAPDDDEFYELLRSSMDALNTAGSTGSYAYHVKNVSTDITDVVINSPNDGEVRIYAITDEGPASSALKTLIAAELSADDTRPLTDHVIVGDADLVNYTIDLEYYISEEATASTAEIQQAVEDAVEEYKAWQRARLGRDINPDKLRKMILDAGAKRCVITTPAFQSLNNGFIPLGTEPDLADTIPELANCTSTSVVNRGREDE